MGLISGYWKIDLPIEEQEKCTIIAQSGLYQPTTELINKIATATFQLFRDSIVTNVKFSAIMHTLKTFFFLNIFMITKTY